MSLLILLICSHGCFIEVCSIQLEVFSKPIVWNILVWVDYNTNKNLSRNLIIFMGTSGSKSFVDGFVQYGNETIFSMVLANVSHIFTCKYWNMNFFPLQFKYLNILWLTSHFCWYFFFFWWKLAYNLLQSMLSPFHINKLLIWIFPMQLQLENKYDIHDMHIMYIFYM